MAPDEAILAIADRIDQESGRNDEQEQKINNLQNQNGIQEESLIKQQEKTNCELRKRDCDDKMTPLQAKIKSSKDSIVNIRNVIIPDYKKALKECPEKGYCFATDRIKDAEESLAKYEKNLPEMTAQLNELLNGECKDYQNPCE